MAARPLPAPTLPPCIPRPFKKSTICSPHSEQGPERCAPVLAGIFRKPGRRRRGWTRQRASPFSRRCPPPPRYPLLSPVLTPPPGFTVFRLLQPRGGGFDRRGSHNASPAPKNPLGVIPCWNTAGSFPSTWRYPPERVDRTPRIILSVSFQRNHLSHALHKSDLC